MSEREELLARSDRYLGNGAGYAGSSEYASEILRDMATFVRRMPDPAQASRNAVIDECVKAAFSVRYGSPSSRHDKNPKGWHLPRDCTPTDAAMHDNGCIDAAKAIRALSTVPSTHSDGGK